MLVRTVIFSLLLPVSALAAQTASPATAAPPVSAPAQIVFTFEHPQLQPARYTITLREDGSGRFVSQPGSAPVDISDSVYPAPIDRPIHIDGRLRASLFAWARAHRFFGEHCASDRTNLAFTGNKTFAYTGPDGHGSCTFVWAADPALQHLSEQLGAVAFTLEIGRRLGVEDRHDRLGLDSELASLQDAVREQRASDLPNIAPELQTIAGDQLVMDRARRRALSLLSRCESPAKPN